MFKKNEGEQDGWEEILSVENKYFVKRLFYQLKSSLGQGLFRWIVERKEALARENRKNPAEQDWAFPAPMVREIRISLN